MQQAPQERGASLGTATLHYNAMRRTGFVRGLHRRGQPSPYIGFITISANTTTIAVKAG
jgi:hypothetical protein